MGLGFFEILILAVIGLLIFGSGRIPKSMENLGESIKAFKKGLSDDDKTPPKA